MIIDNTTIQAAGNQAALRPADTVEQKRKAQEKDGGVVEAAAKGDDIQPEELLEQIKEIAEDGQYSVRFEKNRESDSLVIKILDAKTDEVIRQVPSEDILSFRKHLAELKGNIIDTKK